MKALIESIATRHGLDPAIVSGICMQESSLNPDAARHEPEYRWVLRDTRLKPPTCTIETELVFQRTSWGLMQVMGAVFREQGLSGWLNAVVKDPALQLEYGCRHLKKKIQTWGLEPGILAYNAGTPRRDAAGRYVNQYYLDNVLRFAKEW